MLHGRRRGRLRPPNAAQKTKVSRGVMVGFTASWWPT